MIFNIVVDVVVRAVLDVFCGPQESKHGLGWAAVERNTIFYADNGRIAMWYHEWSQDALSETMGISQRIGLETNLNKSKTMVCMPGYIWGDWE